MDQVPSARPMGCPASEAAKPSKTSEAKPSEPRQAKQRAPSKKGEAKPSLRFATV